MVSNKGVYGGAKGILIFAPLVRRKQSEETADGNKSEARLVGFRGVHVFAQEDTPGQPLPQLSECQVILPNTPAA
jgi:hypothetical protein